MIFANLSRQAYSVPFIISLSMVVIHGCGAQSDQMQTPSVFGGFITEINTSTTKGEHVILAESHADKLIHRCSITVSPETKIFRWDGQAMTSIAFDEVKIKDKIKAWLISADERSYPQKGKAVKMVVATGISLDGIQ